MFFGKYPPERAWCVQCDTGKGPHQAGCPNSPKWPPEKEPACPANPAPQGDQQQQEPSSDGQSQYKERWSGSKAKPLLHVKADRRLTTEEADAICAALDGRLEGWSVLATGPDIQAASHLPDISGLIEAIQVQTKAIEAYSADVREYTKATANLTIHIGLLIQAMADGEDDSGDMASVRTLG